VKDVIRTKNVLLIHKNLLFIYSCSFICDVNSQTWDEATKSWNTVRARGVARLLISRRSMTECRRLADLSRADQNLKPTRGNRSQTDHLTGNLSFEYTVNE
jgi:hypothetical protein